MADQPRFMTLPDVAAELAVSQSQMYALVKSGDLPAIQIGGRGQWRVERVKLEEYIARMYEQASAARSRITPEDVAEEGVGRYSREQVKGLQNTHGGNDEEAPCTVGRDSTGPQRLHGRERPGAHGNYRSDSVRTRFCVIGPADAAGYNTRTSSVGNAEPCACPHNCRAHARASSDSGAANTGASRELADLTPRELDQADRRTGRHQGRQRRVPGRLHRQRHHRRHPLHR